MNGFPLIFSPGAVIVRMRGGPEVVGVSALVLVVVSVGFCCTAVCVVLVVFFSVTFRSRIFLVGGSKSRSSVPRSALAVKRKRIQKRKRIGRIFVFIV